MRLTSNFFIYPSDNGMILWNYETHEQYLIDEETLITISRLSGKDQEACLSEKSLLDLKDGGFFVEVDEEPSAWKWDILSKIFHFGTKDIKISDCGDKQPESWVREYVDYCKDLGAPPERRKIDSVAKIVLPRPNLKQLKEKTFYEVISARKTSRVFRETTVSIQTLSEIIFASFGHFHGSWSNEFTKNNLELTAIRKTSPSGGGLHPVEAYLVPFSVEFLKPGVYRYEPDDHSLSRISEQNYETTIVDMLFGQYYAKNIAFGVFLTARIDLAAWKYKHSRAYRNILLDVGHISQTFQMVTTAHGLGTWLTGAFNDTRIEECIGIDGYNEAVFFFLAAGDGTGEAFDKTMRDVVGKF